MLDFVESFRKVDEFFSQRDSSILGHFCFRFELFYFAALFVIVFIAFMSRGWGWEDDNELFYL